MRKNTKRKYEAFTHEGAPAALHVNGEAILRRSVMACLLWENEFYEGGQSIADRIRDAAHKVPLTTLANVAIEARTEQNLRHVPLLLVREMLRHKEKNPTLTAETITKVIQRADELAEILAVYWATNEGKRSLPHALLEGLRGAFGKFDEYRLAKYNRDGAVKLRDVLRLARPKPRDDAQSDLWRRLKAGELKTPDTWEVALSTGKDKKETFERLINEGNLGYLALLRNLRNMEKAGVDKEVVREAILARKGGADRVLPFRYVAAARAAPSFEPWLDKALLASIEAMPKLDGETIVLVDVSGSMNWAMSSKSDMKRIDAAAALAALVPGNVRMFSFSTKTVEVPPRKGMSGVDAIINSQPHGGTDLGGALRTINAIGGHRLIVITDEQSGTRVGKPKFEYAYMINVASYKNGVGYGDGWIHIDGFSEGIFKYITAVEAE